MLWGSEPELFLPHYGQGDNKGLHIPRLLDGLARAMGHRRQVWVEAGLFFIALKASHSKSQIKTLTVQKTQKKIIPFSTLLGREGISQSLGFPKVVDR